MISAEFSETANFAEPVKTCMESQVLEIMLQSKKKGQNKVPGKFCQRFVASEWTLRRERD